MITENIYAAEVEVPLNPFPGLRPFEFHESNLYFGRDGQSERMLSKLAARHFVAVVGTSGSGKSSLVRAGLLPALFGGFMPSAGSNWRVALMRPGNDPLGNLARALNDPTVFGSDIAENAALQTVITEATLRRGSLGLVEAVRQTRMPSNENLLVVVDQFEELFRFARVTASERYQNEAAAFVKLLLEAIEQRDVPIYVVLTLRSDYLGDCALFWDLPEAINESQFLIPRLTREQRREAITGPVAVCGGEISSRLVNRLLNDVGDNQDQLPILQHALMRAWDNWRADHAEGEPIDLRHYEATGGMGAALSLHADEAYAELSNERERRLAERMFKGLTERGADNREIRRPLELQEICALTEASEEEVVAVLEPFRREGRSFLMPPASVRLTPESVIDISHESLIRCWGRLNEWVEEESRSARIYLRLAETAALYRRDAAELLRDPELHIALDWRAEDRPNEAWARRYHPDFEIAMDFLEQSREIRDLKAYAKERARRRELRRTRLVAVVFIILFLFSIAAMAMALAARREALIKSSQLERQTKIAEDEKANAQRQRAIAEEQKELAESQRLKAESNFAEAEEARKATLEQKKKAEEQTLIARENERKAVTAKAEAERQKTLALKQESIAKEASSLAYEQSKIAHAAGRSAIAEAERANNLLYASDLNLSQQTYRSGNIIRARYLLNGFEPKTDAPEAKDLRGYEWYYLWRIYHKELQALEGHSDTVISVVFSPDGRTIATAGVDGKVKLWDAVSRHEVASPNWGARAVTSIASVAFSPDSRTLAVAADDNTIRLWDTTAPGKEPSVLRGPSAPLYAVAFSPDGSTLAAGGEDKNVWLWRLTGAPAAPRTLAGHQEMLRAVAYSPDGKTLASAGIDGTVRLWDLSAPSPKPTTLATQAQPVLSLSFSADGARLAAGGDDGSINLWNMRAPGRKAVTLKGHEGAVESVAFSPDGRTLASGGEDKTVRLWDTTKPDGAPLTIGNHTDIVSSVAFSQDGRVLASGGYDKRVKLWDIGSERGLATLKGIGALVRGVAYSPDGRMLATGNAEGEVKIWDARTRRELASFKAHEDSVWSLAFSPDGRTLATVSRDTTVKLWKLDEPTHAPVVLPGGFTQAVYTVAFSSDGRMLAAAGDDKTIKVWNLNARDKQPLTLAGHASAVTSAAFSPDGKRLVSGGMDGTIRLWDLSAESPRGETLGEGFGPIWAVAYSLSPDPLSPGERRELVAAGGDYSMLLLYDVSRRKWLDAISGHENAIRSITFSPDGRTLATGSTDKTVRLWSAVSMQELVKLEGHLGAVTSVAFSPDGRTLASGSFDGYVKLWYAATDEEVAAEGKR
jgi:WD40 repeat protein/energy-coupling factor transporter ATP-binding protein EcfA2